LGEPTVGLVRVAASLTDADGQVLAGLMRAALGRGTPAQWLEELTLAAVLFVGFPRALVAAGALRAVVPEPAGVLGDAADYARWREWQERGELTCRRVYGSNYEKLRENVRRLHPALDAWILADGYGRILSRPGLDLPRRELCAIAMLVPQRAGRQLHSHFVGARNVGVPADEIDALLDVVAAMATVPGSRVAAARRLWSEVRPP
jgi:4-carboxymuconolactone decarboxylase